MNKYIHNSNNAQDVRLFELSAKKSSCKISKEGITTNILHGFFCEFDNRIITLVSSGGELYLCIDNHCELLSKVFITYSGSGANRLFEVVYPGLEPNIFTYTEQDLVPDRALLTGSYEEPEDYDFCLFVYNIYKSIERQKILIEEWK